VQQIAPVQVLSITAGPTGADSNGGFALTQERSIFSRADDREVIVLFRWEDVPGTHKLVAQWRSPDGAASVSSAIDYKAAEKRFGAYWRLPVSPGMALGTWSIEVAMDGRPAGRFTFEITDANVAAAPARRALTEAEIYERLNAAFVVLRRSRADGVELDPAAAFMVAPETGRLHTVVAAIDSADTIPVAAQAATETPTPLIQLRTSGALMPAVAGASHVASGGFSRAGKRNDSSKTFVEAFTTADKQIVAAIAWAPTDRVRGQGSIRLFDAENTMIAASQPKRVNYNRGSYSESRWEFPLPPKPGMYRVDVLVDATTYWRGFFRLDP
jgi:hypothetical protein